MHFSPFFLNTSLPQWNITHCHQKAKKQKSTVPGFKIWRRNNKNGESETDLLSSVSLIFNKLATFARTCADATTLEGKLSWAKPTFSRISLILAAAMRDQSEWKASILLLDLLYYIRKLSPAFPNCDTCHLQLFLSIQSINYYKKLYIIYKKTKLRCDLSNFFSFLIKIIFVIFC